MQQHQLESRPATTEDAVIELIRLYEAEAQHRARLETELRSEVAALWLRVGQLQRNRTWLRRIIG